MLIDNRKFVRHDVKVPLEVSSLPSAGAAALEVENVSFGGLAFYADEALEVGQVVAVNMPTVKPPFAANASVAWCRPDGLRYYIGVAFTNSDDATQLAMVEQVCAVERYRVEQMKKGRRISPEQAAGEWNDKHPHGLAE
jgi:PilZ domain